MWGHYSALQQSEGVYEQKHRLSLHHYVTTSNTTTTYTHRHVHEL